MGKRSRDPGLLTTGDVDQRFRDMRRSLLRHDTRWALACRAKSCARRCVPTHRTLLAIGYCGVFFGGPLPPHVDDPAIAPQLGREVNPPPSGE